MDEARRFREELEKRTGEKQLATAMAAILEGGRDAEASWGILVLTDAALRFERPPSRHWTASLLKTHDRTSPPVQPADIVVPLRDLISAAVPRRGLIGRLFGSPFAKLDVSWMRDGVERRETFSVDPGSGLLEELERALPASTDTTPASSTS